MITARFDPADLFSAWEESLSELAAADVVSRLWSEDHTVIQEDPTECADRFGWLTVVADSRSHWSTWTEWGDGVADEIDHVVVLGMGGSSLFPEVLARTFTAGDGFPELHVLDTTDPAAVARMLADCPAERTLCVVSSKSGSTIETRSHLDLFWDRLPDGRALHRGDRPGIGPREAG